MKWNSPYINQFTQPDSIIPDQANPQSWNRYSYVTNNPLRYTDPTGHVRVEGCTELAGGCHVNQYTVDDDLRNENEFRQTTDRNQCKAGNKLHCSYAENHPVETVAFVGGGLLLAGAGAAAVVPTAVTTEAIVTMATTIELANTACGGDICAGEVDELSRVFHSGRGTQALAEAFARANNAVTLSQTEQGAELNQILDALGYNVMRPFAEAASAEWAAGASGSVNVIIRLPLNPNNIWATVEYPSLLANKAVTQIILHFIE